MDDIFIKQINSDKETIARLEAWTLQLYAIQHFDEAIKLFCNEVYEGLQARSVIFFKYLKSFSSILATYSEGIPFSEIRGVGLDFSHDKNFSPVKDFIRLNQNNSFIEIMKKISPHHDFVTSLCVVRGEVKGVFVFTDVEPERLEDSYYKLIERVFSHWLSEIILLEQNHNLNRIDELTELLNKKVFSEYVALEVGRSQRIKHPVSYMVVRLDQAERLKSNLNLDRYQSLVKMIGKIITQSVRKTDYVGALSEGEFGIVLPHMSLKNARNKAKQLKTILERAKYFSDMDINVHINFSICISEYPMLAHDFEDLQLSAQQKLMLDTEPSQILEVIQSQSFEPDFRYIDVESKK